MNMKKLAAIFLLLALALPGALAEAPATVSAEYTQRIREVEAALLTPERIGQLDADLTAWYGEGARTGTGAWSVGAGEDILTMDEVPLSAVNFMYLARSEMGENNDLLAHEAYFLRYAQDGALAELTHHVVSAAPRADAATASQTGDWKARNLESFATRLLPEGYALSPGSARVYRLAPDAMGEDQWLLTLRAQNGADTPTISAVWNAQYDDVTRIEIIR